MKNSSQINREIVGLWVEISRYQNTQVLSNHRTLKIKKRRWRNGKNPVKTSNFPQLRNSRGSLNLRNKRRARQNYLVELMVAKRRWGKRKKKKDKRRVERTMERGRQKNAAISHSHPSVRPCTFRFINSSVPSPFSSPFSPPFHPLFFTSESVEESTQPSRMSGIYIILRVVRVVRFSFDDETRVRFNFCSINFNLIIFLKENKIIFLKEKRYDF